MSIRPTCFAHSIAIIALDLRLPLVYVSCYVFSRTTIDELIFFIAYHPHLRLLQCPIPANLSCISCLQSQRLAISKSRTHNYEVHLQHQLTIASH